MKDGEWIKPCPCCGSETANVFQLPMGFYMVGCGRCPLEMRGPNRAAAIVLWNTRPDPVPVGNHDLPWFESWLDARFGRAEFLQLNRMHKLRRIREVAAELMEMLMRLKNEGNP